MTESREITRPEKLNPSERFTQLVVKECKSIAPRQFSEREKSLIRGYFVCIDQTLSKTEAERVRKNNNNSDHKYDNNLPCNWNTINLPQLAKDLAHYAYVGLDMMEDNTLFPIPYKDNKANLYTITLMEGYNGLRYQAEKYALDPFRGVTVEVVYANDSFRPIKKSAKNPVESYEFDITNPFDRGDPIGVFGYIEYDDPAKNKLVIFSKRDVEKRKPKYAAPEFWGGQKKVRKNGKEEYEAIEGWVPEMWEKTMKRHIYGSKNIPRDPAKMDASYQYILQREAQFADIAIEAEVVENANAAPISLPEPAPQPTPVQEEAPAPMPPESVAEIDDDDEAPF